MLSQRSSSGIRASGSRELVQLCDKPAVLGQRLCDAVVSLSSANRELNAKRKCYNRACLLVCAYTNSCRKIKRPYAITRLLALGPCNRFVDGLDVFHDTKCFLLTL